MHPPRMRIILILMKSFTVPNLRRRTVLTALMAAAATPALALSGPQAEGLVAQVVADINAVINSGKSESRMYNDFEKVFRKYGDVPTIARYVLGVDGRRASARQMRAFTQAYTSYVARKYGSRFRQFIGGRIEVQGSRKVRSNIEVITVAKLRGEAPFEVTFSVSDRSGRDKFFNMTIEGVNMLLTERTEVGAILDRHGGNIDALIQDLKQR